MTFTYTFAGDEHRRALQALRHPDGTTRLQTVRVDDDPDLHALLEAFGARTGYPVLCNTSLNGPGEPIVETPEEACRWLLDHPLLDALVLGDELLIRRDPGLVLRDRTLVPVHDRLRSETDRSGGAGRPG
jgi:carbamoyltransferase